MSWPIFPDCATERRLHHDRIPHKSRGPRQPGQPRAESARMPQVSDQVRKPMGGRTDMWPLQGVRRLADGRADSLSAHQAPTLGGCRAGAAAGYYRPSGVMQAKNLGRVSLLAPQDRTKSRCSPLSLLVVSSVGFAPSSNG